MGVDYIRPKSIAEAGDFMQKHPGAKLLAGGTDLVLAMRQKRVSPTYLVDLGDIADLKCIVGQDGGLTLGSMATIEALAQSAVIKEKFPVIAAAAGHLGCWQVRNRATLGGNLANAAPSAEMAPPLMALGAEVKLTGAAGQRVLPLEQFFTGPGQTVLKPGEIVTEIIVPDLPPGADCVYRRHALRRSMDISLANAAVYVHLQNDTVADCRIVLGAVAATPMRANQAEALLKKAPFTSETIGAASRAAADACRPITDVRASADYRRQMIAVLVRRALQAILTPEEEIR